MENINNLKEIYQREKETGNFKLFNSNFVPTDKNFSDVSYAIRANAIFNTVINRARG